MEKKAGLIIKAIYTIVVFIAGFMVAYGVLNISLFGQPLFSPVGDVALSPPGDYFSTEDVLLYDDQVVINIENARLNYYDSTGSMIPVLYEGAIGISVVPESADEVNVGDIVSYNKNGNLLVHRVISKSSDGTTFVVKGDNAPTEDTISFEDIEHKLVGVLY